MPSGNQNLNIEEERTTHMPKENKITKEQTKIYKKHTHKTKDRVTPTPLIPLSLLFQDLSRGQQNSNTIAVCPCN